MEFVRHWHSYQFSPLAVSALGHRKWEEMDPKDTGVRIKEDRSSVAISQQDGMKPVFCLCIPQLKITSKKGTMKIHSLWLGRGLTPSVTAPQGLMQGLSISCIISCNTILEKKLIRWNIYVFLNIWFILPNCLRRSYSVLHSHWKCTRILFSYVFTSHRYTSFESSPISWMRRDISLCFN